MLVRITTLLGLFFLASSSLPAPPEWSVWRGPAGDGHYDHESTWQHDGPPSGPKQLWQTPVHLGPTAP